MFDRKKASPTAYRWLVSAFLAGAALFLFLMAAATWPLWLPLIESDAGRFERVFGRPPPAGAVLLGSATEYHDDCERVGVVFQLAEADFRAFLPDGFRPVAVADLADHIVRQDDAGAVSGAALRACARLEGWRRAPSSGAGAEADFDVEVLYCPDTARGYATAHGTD